jgi:probable HAF family extracellular repeat protein
MMRTRVTRPKRDGRSFIMVAAFVALPALLAACDDANRAPTSPAAAPHPVLGTSGGSYVAVDMGTLPYTMRSQADAINDSGFAVGASGNIADDMRPVMWPSWSVPVALPMPAAARHGEAFAINNAREMAGYVNVNGYDRAIRWRIGFAPQDIGTLGGLQARGRGINSAGTIAGWATVANGHEYAFRWTPLGGMIKLSALSDVLYAAEAWAINDSGTAVGFSTDSSNNQHAVRWTPSGQLQVLPSLGGKNSMAYAIASDGSIVGWAQTSAGVTQAVRWLPNGSMIAYGTLPGGTQSIAMGIAIGKSWSPFVQPPVYVVGLSDPGTQGFYTDPWPTALPPLFAPMNYFARDVNSCGDIVGTGEASSGYSHAVRWTRGGCP